MNVHAGVVGTKVRTADLGDARDLQRIEAFVAADPAARPFHRPQWIKAVAAGCGHRGHLLVAEDGAGIVGLLPLSEIRSRLFGSALVSSGFAVGGGILARDASTVEELATAACVLAAELRCGSVELRGGPVPAGFTGRSGIYAGFSRPLASDEESILLAIPRKQRAEVRKGQQLGLQIEFGRGEPQRQAHYRVYAASVRNLGTPVFPRTLFDAMLDAFGEDSDIVTISQGAQPIASVLSFYFGGCVFPFWGGGTREARGLRANELLYFALMCHAAARGCTRFDFGRSKLGTGPFAYKRNWGFEPEPLTYAVRTLDGSPPRELNPLDPKYRLQVAVWKKMPLWLANRLGPPIARGLG